MEISLEVSGPVEVDGFMDALAQNVPGLDWRVLRVTVEGRAFNFSDSGQIGECVDVLNGFRTGRITISVPDALESQKDIIQASLMAVLLKG